MKEYGFWLYSAMTQATAALFGVIGMFFIFKLQILRDQEKEAKHAVLEVLEQIGFMRQKELERIKFEEVKKKLTDEIVRRERIEQLEDAYAISQAIDKAQNKRWLDLLRDRRDALKIAEDDYYNSAQDSIDVIRILAIIFGFSLTLLILNPLLAKFPWRFILLTLIYIFSLVIAFTKTWRIMGNLLKR